MNSCVNQLLCRDLCQNYAQTASPR